MEESSDFITAVWNNHIMSLCDCVEVTCVYWIFKIDVEKFEFIGKNLMWSLCDCMKNNMYGCFNIIIIYVTCSCKMCEYEYLL